jgi:hypothetical protein
VGEDVARTVTPRGFRLVEVGTVRLKGISNPVTLLEAVRDGDE